MFHVEHLEVASGNFSQKFRFCQFATKIAPYAILPLNTYQLLHLFFKSVFRGGFEGRFFCVFGQKIAAYRFPVRRKRKKSLAERLYVDEQNANVGRRDPRDTARLPQRGRLEFFQFLAGFDSQPRCGFTRKPRGD